MRAGACVAMGKVEGMRKPSMPWNRALRAMSRREYSPLSGIWVSGAAPVCLNTTPSKIGRQLTSRPCRAASASIFSDAKNPYGEEKSK